jgi:hypothetical protein
VERYLKWVVVEVGSGMRIRAAVKHLPCTDPAYSESIMQIGPSFNIVPGAKWPPPGKRIEKTTSIDKICWWVVFNLYIRGIPERNFAMIGAL